MLGSSYSQESSSEGCLHFITRMSRLLIMFSVCSILKHNYGGVDRAIELVEWQIGFHRKSQHPVSVSRFESLICILEELKQRP